MAPGRPNTGLHPRVTAPEVHFSSVCWRWEPPIHRPNFQNSDILPIIYRLLQKKKKTKVLQLRAPFVLRSVKTFFSSGRQFFPHFHFIQPAPATFTVPPISSYGVSMCVCVSECVIKARIPPPCALWFLRRDSVTSAWNLRARPDVDTEMKKLI